MTPEERDLMIKIAKDLKVQGDMLMAHSRILVDLQSKPAVPVDTNPMPVVLCEDGKRIISTLENNGQDRNGRIFKFDITFAGANGMTIEKRRNDSFAFLKELESIFDRYRIARIHGSFENNSYGTF